MASKLGPPTRCSLRFDTPAAATLFGVLRLFGIVFALCSSVHSYLILAYSDGDKVALDVGFYYMANAGGRLLGSLLSGILYQVAGLGACLGASAAMAATAALISLLLPPVNAALPERLLEASGD